MIGTWKGYYKYDDEVAQRNMGSDVTYFTIVINYYDGKIFKGTVKDDVTTGGMEGEGQIVGEVESDKVFFKKLMPKKLIVIRDGKRKYLNHKHPAIYYQGTITSDKKEMEGKWKFKWQIFYLFGVIPFPIKPIPGIWSMSLQ